MGRVFDVYVPLAMQQELQPTWGKRLGDWRSRWLTVMARLNDGVSLPEAQAAANLTYAQLLQEDWAHIKGGSGDLQDALLQEEGHAPARGARHVGPARRSRGRRSWC